MTVRNPRNMPIALKSEVERGMSDEKRYVKLERAEKVPSRARTAVSPSFHEGAVPTVLGAPRRVPRRRLRSSGCEVGVAMALR